MLNKSYWSEGVGLELSRRYGYLILGATALYIPVLLIAQRFMLHRKPFQLKYVCFLWNLSLSIGSGIGALTVLLCDPRCLTQIFLPEAQYHPWVRASICIFCLTKAVEFGDTLLLVFRKKPLRFLHVYHHLTVTLYCWHALKIGVSFGHLFAFINLLIHCFMYLYYAAAMLQSRHPLLLATRSYITVSQTAQMLVGMWLSWTALFYKEGSYTAPSSLERGNALFALLMYTSYAYLFILFYFETYVKGVRPSMVVVVVTLHFGGAVGATFAWNHPHRARILLEIAVGYALTAFSVHLCCLSFPRVFPSHNLVGALLVSDRPQKTSKSGAVALESNSCEMTNGHFVTQSATEHCVGGGCNEKQPFSEPNAFTDVSSKQHSVFTRSQAFTVRSRLTPAAGQNGSSTRLMQRCDHQGKPTAKSASVTKHMTPSTTATDTDFPTTTCSTTGPVRQALVLFNAWLFTALEKQREHVQHTTSIKNLAPPACSDERRGNGGQLARQDHTSSRSTSQLQSNDTITVSLRETPRYLKSVFLSFTGQQKEQQWLFFTASLLVPAAYGFLAHGNILLGFLVHGCLRWVIELYTTGHWFSKRSAPRGGVIA